jgi:hypothetical protein
VIKEEFNLFWESNFKETIPLNFIFRTTYPNRWLRIHSLPNSKRYAENENEINLILERQNQVVSDFISENQEIYIVRSEINVDYNNDYDSHKEFNFQEVAIINLRDLFDDDYDDDDKLSVQVTKKIWQINCFNSLLEDIANDVSLIFFVSINNPVIFAPYDGGMDIIYQSETQRNFYKEKYKNYLSQRKDGL